MSKVFVVQMPTRYDKDKGTYVDRYDITPAEFYGEIVHLLKPNAAPFNSKGIIEQLHDELKDYSDADWILMIGNPILIAFVGAIAAHHNDGKINALQWSGKDGAYIPVRAEGLT